MLHPGPAERVPQRTLESLWGGGGQGPSGIGVSGGGGGWSGSGLAAQPFRRGGGAAGSGWPGPEGEDVPDTRGDAGSAEGAVSICEEAAAHWIYPSHPPRRDYQFSICQAALLRNTLVCLPTGLGKTLIAAVVMYNFYRWFPDGKIVFVAPTKPLVHQQVQACHRIMGIPSAHTAEITGAAKAEDRALWYKHCRVFFATPQTIQNDVRRGLLPAAKVVCLVVDECHRAVGRYASAGIARDLRSHGGARFRVLGLSATPGSTHEAVQQVVANLDIARVEFRGDADPDVAPYTYPRLLEKVVVRPSGSLAECREKLLRSLEAAVAGLAARGFAFNANTVENLNRFVFIQAQRALRANPGLANRGAAVATADGDTEGGGARAAVAATHLLLEQAILLASLREQFDLHGAEVAWNYLLGQQQNPRNGLRRLLEESQTFKSFHARLDFLVSQGAYNPKVEELKNILRENLVSEKAGGGPSSSTAVDGVGGRGTGAGGAAIVFTTLRNSVDNILKALTGEPGLRAQAFVGQGGSRGDRSEGSGGVVKARRGMSQKEQKQVLKDFREGRFNVLVATCVAEEGLDIPEVSLIVCFDTSASPGRNTQRIGRTGRHGQGKVVYLLSAGKEEKDYARNQALTRRLHNHLRSGGQNFELSRRSPRMVPHRFSPACRVEDIQVSQGAHGNPLLRSLQNSLWKNADALKDISNAFKGFGGGEGPTSKPSAGPGGGDPAPLAGGSSSSEGGSLGPMPDVTPWGETARNCEAGGALEQAREHKSADETEEYESDESDGEESDVPLPRRSLPPALEPLPAHRSSGRIQEFAKRYSFDCPEVGPELRDVISWARDGTLRISEPPPDGDEEGVGGGGRGLPLSGDLEESKGPHREEGGEQEDGAFGGDRGVTGEFLTPRAPGDAFAHPERSNQSSGSDAFEELRPAAPAVIPPLLPVQGVSGPYRGSPRTPVALSSQRGLSTQFGGARQTPATHSSLEMLPPPARGRRREGGARWVISESPEEADGRQQPQYGGVGPSPGSGGSSDVVPAVPAAGGRRRPRRPGGGGRVLRESDEFSPAVPTGAKAQKRPCLFVDDEAEASDDGVLGDLPPSQEGGEPRRTSLDDFIVPTQTESTPLSRDIDMRAAYRRGAELTPRRAPGSLPTFNTPRFRGGTKMRFQGGGLLDAMLAAASPDEASRGGDEGDGNEDCCRICGEPGELLLCDSCPAGFHLRCLGFQTLPSQTLWFCEDCQRRRRQ